MLQKPKSVLLFLPCAGTHLQDAFAGVRDDVASRNWDFFSADITRTEDGTVQFHRSSRSVGSVAELVAILRPDGIIVWEDALSPSEVRAAVGADVPTVFVDCGTATEKEDVARVRSDPDSIAAIAARVLLPSRYDDFAFVPNPVPMPWSQERGDAFQRCIEVAGKRFHRFKRGTSLSLERWLSSLPKPCGVFTANDAVGEEVLGACAQLGFAVPDDIAVIGVDDHAYFCEATKPTLSSIAMASSK